MIDIPRPEYPRPQFARQDNWLNLNGEWEFSLDKDTFDMRIIVPYAYQTKLSGINIQDFHDVVWYRKYFDLPDHMKSKRIILHFGAVDYECDVWVNGVHVTNHIGGHIGFQVEITHVVKDKANEIIVRAKDDALDLEMPLENSIGKKAQKVSFTQELQEYGKLFGLRQYPIPIYIEYG